MLNVDTIKNGLVIDHMTDSADFQIQFLHDSPGIGITGLTLHDKRSIRKHFQSNFRFILCMSLFWKNAHEQVRLPRQPAAVEHPHVLRYLR